MGNRSVSPRSLCLYEDLVGTTGLLLTHISCSEIHRYPSNNLALLQSQESCNVFVLEHKKSARGPAIISSVACLVTYLTLKQD